MLWRVLWRGGACICTALDTFQYMRLAFTNSALSVTAVMGLLLSSSVFAAPARKLTHIGTGYGAPPTAKRALQQSTSDFDDSCDRHELGCKTLAACDVDQGYPMTEDRHIFDTICLANTYWAEPGHSGLYDADEYLSGQRQGYYKCSCCGLPLYSSAHAYDAHSGWPAFWDTIDGEATSDNSQAVLHNPENGEVVCKRCGMHLGHRFSDGPRPTELRDCIDSACLSFVEGEAYPPPEDLSPPPPPIPVYFGAGCYWHTNYDLYLVETEQFGRGPLEVTSHVGYGGGPEAGPDGLVCYHNSAGASLYSDLHFAESTQVILDGSNATQQFAALLEAYFDEFHDTQAGVNYRQDPQDWGAPYRNNIGIPGGVDGELYPQIVAARLASGRQQMPLVRGQGAPDTIDEQTIYVYDTETFPFYRAEQYHQFHTNNVLRRPVPDSYTRDLKNTQAAAGLINPTGCPDQPVPGTPLESGWQLCENVVAPDQCRYIGTTTRGESSVTVTVNLPADSCDIGNACGTVVYTPTDITTGSTCHATFSYTSVENSGSSTIYNFAELMMLQGAECVGSPSIQLAAVSGGIGLRSFDGTTATLAPVTCGVELNQVFLDRFNTICDGEGDAENGLPSSCSTACAAMWLPFAQSCDSYLQQVHPELAPFTQLCEATTAIDNGH